MNDQQAGDKIRFILTALFLLAWMTPVFGQGIHNAPIVLKGQKLLQIVNYPISMYRLFRNDGNGRAVAIPFQIDEVNTLGDFVLDSGKYPNSASGNGIFDIQDELVFMGNDMGPAQMPVRWPEKKPPFVHEVTLTYTGQEKVKTQVGAIYVGLFFANAPPKSDAQYVSFNERAGEVKTSRYRYQFNPKNYLTVKSVDMISSITGQDNNSIPLISSSTFYLYADLKYFLSIALDHRDVDSELEAYKVGPVRSIVRFSFYYTLLKLQFKLGLYTELSFFSNAVYLPAILYNPLNGPKTLSSGSGFYYGFALNDNPGALNVQSNMPPYGKESVLNLLKRKFSPDRFYWMTATSQKYMIYMEINPSQQMIEQGNVPQLYVESIDGPDAQKRAASKPKPLGQSPVNMALFFDLSRFSEGEHNMSLRLYFENHFAPERLQDLRTLNFWRLGYKRIQVNK